MSQQVPNEDQSVPCSKCGNFEMPLVIVEGTEVLCEQCEYDEAEAGRLGYKTEGEVQ